MMALGAMQSPALRQLDTLVALSVRLMDAEPAVER
jgi:hypothetical protein